MARFLKGINGAYSGKVGNVIGSNWRGIDYVRSLPKKSNKPATEAQLAQRAKFALAVSFISPITDVVNLGFSDVRLNRSSGYNMALKTVLDGAIDGLYPDYEISFENVQISRGALSPLSGLTTSESNPQELTLSWQNRVNRFNAFADDSVIVLLYDVDERMFSIFEGAVRGDETYSIQFPPNYAGHTITGWVFTGHRDGIKTSNSQFIGGFVLS